jgi:hypothetical protein
MASAKLGHSFYSPPGLVTYTFLLLCMYEPSLLLLIIKLYNSDGCVPDHPPHFILLKLLCDGDSTLPKNPGRVTRRSSSH